MSEATSPPVVVYIAGYGRSGSTLLDILLGSHPRVQSLGEVGAAWDLLGSADAECSCAAALAQCRRWSAILAPLLGEDDPRRLARLCAEFEGWTGLMRQRARPAGAGEYAELQRRLLVGAVAGTGRDIVVDSSKTAYRFARRPWALHALAGIDLRLIHLVRDPAQVVAACAGGQNSRLRRGDHRVRPLAGVVALAGWNFANVLALWNRQRLPPEAYLRVHYEDLADRPQAVIAAIGDFLNLDVAPLLSALAGSATFHADHLIGGNRLASQPGVRVEKRLAEAAPGHVLERMLTAAFAAPLYRVLRGGSGGAAGAAT
jgi:hypothetical protein